MKALTHLLLVALLLGGDGNGQSDADTTGTISVARAIDVVRTFRAGMTQQEADAELGRNSIRRPFVRDTNGVVWGSFGGIGSGLRWSVPYELAQNCELVLGMRPKEVRGDWGFNGLLESATIRSNSVTIVTISLTGTDGPHYMYSVAVLLVVLAVSLLLWARMHPFGHGNPANPTTA